MPAKIIKQPRITEKEIFDFLQKRQGLLEGVVLCGGEPTINKELPQFVKKIKDLGYSVKLDTNGSNPKMLEDLVVLGLIDYVAMDIKSAPSNKIYETIFTEGIKMEHIKKSVDFLKNNGIDFEFRTTVVDTIHKKEEFSEIAEWIGGPNVKYYLQNFRPEKTIDPEFEKIKPLDRKFLEGIAKDISPHFKDCQVRQG